MLGGFIGAGLLGLAVSVPTVVRGWIMRTPKKYVRRVERGVLVIVKTDHRWAVYYWQNHGEGAYDPIDGPYLSTDVTTSAKMAEDWYRNEMARTRRLRFYETGPNRYAQEQLLKKWRDEKEMRRRRTMPWGGF